MTYFTRSFPFDDPSPYLWRRLTDAELHSAMTLASGIAPETVPELHRDMIQWAEHAYFLGTGSRDVFLNIPHTGYCVYVNITPVLNLPS